MNPGTFQIESKTPFSNSIIWQLNRDFYEDKGITAWSQGIVPHQLTSNSKVGETYAELIFAFLNDLATKGKTQDIVYLLELGAGHGRLAFHILYHLQKLVDFADVNIPKYCYVVSDFVEDNLTFFLNHPQFQEYYKKGILDVAHYDAIEGNELHLLYSKKSIYPKDLTQPIIAIANYFFDSIPNDLFLIKDAVISTSSISIDSSMNPDEVGYDALIKSLELTYHNDPITKPQYEEETLNKILEDYRHVILNSYLFFPEKSLTCLGNLKRLSKSGLLLLTMDKGFHEIHNLQSKKEPEIIPHGSFSIWVNYHAINSYCLKQGGTTLFPSFSNFNLEIGCLLFLSNGESYKQTNAAYQKVVNNFGPDDFNSIKKIAYQNMSKLDLQELIAILRLSAYDSTIFIKLLPRLKQVCRSITKNEHTRLIQVLHTVWEIYFHINESYDLPYELGGIYYDLGHYAKALKLFHNSEDLFGSKADIFYNKALCYYQLREDKLFYQAWHEGQNQFPNFKPFNNLKDLVMT